MSLSNRICLAIVSGILLTAAFPPVNLAFVAWFSVVPLLFAVNGGNPRTSFFLGYLCGIIWNLGSLYWVHIYHVAALPLVVFILSFYPALFCLGLALLLKGKKPRAFILVAPVLWAALEYIRSLGYTGFPWNSLGYSQYMFLPVIQIAEFTGVFGVSFLIVFVNSCLVFLVRSFRKPAVAFKIAVIAGIVPATCILLGFLMMRHSGVRDGHMLKVALIQPNFPARYGWSGDSPAAIERLRKLSAKAAACEPELIIWPETAIDESVLADDSGIKPLIRRLLDETGAYLLTGALHSDNGKDYNSAFLIGARSGVIGRYDKMHLVPAGEYFPVCRHTVFMENLLSEAGDFTPGKNHTVFELNGHGKFSVLICFEGIFGDLTRRFVRQGAQFLVNITNDAWSCSKTSHYQHAAMATFRAVENRCWFVRVGNTGISRIINPYGVIRKELGYNKMGILAGHVCMNKRETFYTRFGDLFSKILLCVVVVLLCKRLFISSSRKTPRLS